MTTQNFIQQQLNTVIQQQEGGWVLTQEPDGSDGGWTYGGMTAKTFNEYRVKHCGAIALTFEMVQETLKETMQTLVMECYQDTFIHPIIQYLPDILVGPFLSASINCGEDAACRALQSALNMCTTYKTPGNQMLAVDGEPEDKTKQAIEYIVNMPTAPMSSLYLHDYFLWEWLRHYIRICVTNPAKLPDLEGWFNRVEFWRA